MKLNFTFKHLDHSDSLVSYTEEKLAEVGRFLLKEGYGNVYVSKQKNEFCIEVSINTREKYFKAAAFGTDIYAVADLVSDKLETQILKLNKQVKSHKKPEASKEARVEQAMRLKKAA